ncbi:TnsA endonuclease N-terminal domain-containing protein [Endozoicomonas euniceicola]|uniref:TnsA endonuclease N-terminal domain-containing protein n=1 Tax=Endozoicomonas euniceicola TaxID=1234143 RepID=A0ABY6GW14_9GAMM|nr:TnsA endonuclease N-terminal domain-containing protein [Endozoicomonas euniceicola]UYM16286.1 TnsA endonuclease N-terminal domain-containing protein [Endozoicomonas euniceicola]
MIIKTETEGMIQKKFDEGRGQGFGADYLPWLFASDISNTISYRIRVKGRHNRVYHLASRYELWLFLMLEKNRWVTDIREQFPLDRSLTLPIAKATGIAHPGHSLESKVAQVMTVDFIVTVDYGTGYQKDIAIPFIDSKNLLTERELELLEIARIYCLERNYGFKIVTELDIDRNLVDGMHWSFSKWNFENDEWAKENLVSASMTVKSMLKAYYAKPISIRDFCNHINTIEKWPVGNSLSVFRYLLATRELDYDYFSKPINENTKISEIEIVSEK